MNLVTLFLVPRSLDVLVVGGDVPNKVARTDWNNSVWTIPLCAKWDREIKSAVDSSVYQQSHCPWRGLLLLDLSAACGRVCLCWKVISIYNWDGRAGIQALMSYFKAIFFRTPPCKLSLFPQYKICCHEHYEHSDPFLCKYIIKLSPIWKAVCQGIMYWTTKWQLPPNLKRPRVLSAAPTSHSLSSIRFR